MKDERDDQQKAEYPWWWRDRDFLEQLGGLTVLRSAYCYELGRRYQIHQNKNPLSRYKSLSEILIGATHKGGNIKFQLMKCFDLETIDAGVLVDPLPRKLSKSGIKKFNNDRSGSWVQTNVVAWNLECPWKEVVGKLKAQFEQQQAELGVKTDAQSRKIQTPHWQNLETWDNWWANIITFKTAGAHQRKTYEIARLAKPYAGQVNLFLDALKEFGIAG